MGIKQAPEIIKMTPTEVRNVNMAFPASDFATGETLLAAPTVVFTPSGPTFTVPVTSGFTVQFRITGALVVDTDYEVKVSAPTSLSQTLEGCGLLRVKAC